MTKVKDVYKIKSSNILLIDTQYLNFDWVGSLFLSSGPTLSCHSSY